MLFRRGRDSEKAMHIQDWQFRFAEIFCEDVEIFCENVEMCQTSSAHTHLGRYATLSHSSHVGSKLIHVRLLLLSAQTRLRRSCFLESRGLCRANLPGRHTLPPESPFKTTASRGNHVMKGTCRTS